MGRVRLMINNKEAFQEDPIDGKTEGTSNVATVLSKEVKIIEARLRFAVDLEAQVRSGVSSSTADKIMDTISKMTQLIDTVKGSMEK